MKNWLKKVRSVVSRNASQEHEAREKMSRARLEEVQAEARQLRERGDKASAFLIARHERNHWGEAIALMIKGDH